MVQNIHEKYNWFEWFLSSKNYSKKILRGQPKGGLNDESRSNDL